MLDDPEVRFPAVQIVVSSTSSRGLLGPTQHLILWAPKFFHWNKAVMNDADQCEVKYEWSCTSTLAVTSWRKQGQFYLSINWSPQPCFVRARDFYLLPYSRIHWVPRSKCSGSDLCNDQLPCSKKILILAINTLFSSKNDIRNILPTIKRMKAKWIANILRRMRPLKHGIEGKVKGIGRWRRREKRQLDGLEENRRYCNLTAYAPDRTADYWQTEWLILNEWMNEWWYNTK